MSEEVTEEEIEEAAEVVLEDLKHKLAEGKGHIRDELNQAIEVIRQVYRIKDFSRWDEDEVDALMDRLLDHLTEFGKQSFYDYLEDEHKLKWIEGMSIEDKRRTIKETWKIMKGRIK